MDRMTDTPNSKDAPAPAQPAGEMVKRLRDALAYLDEARGWQDDGMQCAGMQVIEAEKQIIDAARESAAYIEQLEREKAGWQRHCLQADQNAGDQVARAEAAEERARKAVDLLRGYRKMVNAVAPHFDKPVTDDNVVHWLNLNNAGATVDDFLAAIDAARRGGEEV